MLEVLYATLQQYKKQLSHDHERTLIPNNISCCQAFRFLVNRDIEERIDCIEYDLGTQEMGRGGHAPANKFQTIGRTVAKLRNSFMPNQTTSNLSRSIFSTRAEGEQTSEMKENFRRSYMQSHNLNVPKKQ